MPDHNEAAWLESVLTLIKEKIFLINKKLEIDKGDIYGIKKSAWENSQKDIGEIANSKLDLWYKERIFQDRISLIKRLSRQSFSPFFGRIDFHEEGRSTMEKVYIGINTLFDQDELNIVIYDWRAPISSMFYDCAVGKAEYKTPDGLITGNILVKKQYKIADGQLEYMFDSDIKIDDDLLQEALGNNTNEKMKQIVSTIQREQNNVIRNEGAKILAVQGPAGSGKTSVALHRAAYLLYKKKSQITADNITIFSPNKIFSDYISNVLPELGEENVGQMTFEELAASILGKKIKLEKQTQQLDLIYSSAAGSMASERELSIKFKTGFLFLKVLKYYAQYLTMSFHSKTILINGKVILTQKEIEQLYFRVYKNMPPIKRLKKLKNKVASIANLKGAEIKKQINQAIDAMFGDTDAIKLYQKLFLNEDMLLRITKSEKEDDNIKKICRFSAETISEKHLLYEDIAPLIIFKFLIEGDRPNIKIKHLIIDEVQDYTPIQFEIFKKTYPNADFTMLGDLHQSINPFMGLGNYTILKDIYQDGIEFITLKNSYRSTFEISQFANGILDLKSEANIFKRNGTKPLLMQCRDLDEIIEKTTAMIARMKKDGCRSIAILCKNQEESASAYAGLAEKIEIKYLTGNETGFYHGTVLLPIYLAKGLEFDGVIIFNLSKDNYPRSEDKNLIYTGCTRALHRLAILYNKELSPLVNHGDRSLVPR